MRGLGAFCGERLVVVLLGRVGIEAEVELVAPAEVEARLGERVVADLGGGVALARSAACAASLSMSLALIARKRSAFSTATSGAISFALYSPSVVTAMGSIVSSVSALLRSWKVFLVGVNWSALTDARRPSTRMALGIVRRRSGIRRYDDLCVCRVRVDGVPLSNVWVSARPPREKCSLPTAACVADASVRLPAAAAQRPGHRASSAPSNGAHRGAEQRRPQLRD